MTGMDATTGKPLDGEGHLRQSIADILGTPLGTRVCRRGYGSLLFELVDQPMNAVGRLRLFAATADALMRWEPRLRLTRVALEATAAAGVWRLLIEGRRLDTPAPTTARFAVPFGMAD